MTNQNNLEELIGQDLIGSDGDKIGSISDIYLDDETNQPEWFAVSSGLFNKKMAFVPIQGMTQTGDSVQVTFSKDQVHAAPRADADGSLSQQEEASLYSHYGVPYSEARSDSGLPGGAPTGTNNMTSSNEGHDTSGPNTDNAMTRSAEEMSVSTETHETGRARLRKYLVTTEQSVTVPVTHEEVRVVTEPITGENVDSAMSGNELSEEEHEVVLHSEEAVVSKKVVPKERVRLETEQVTTDQQVVADLTEERITTEDDAAKNR